MNEKSLRRWIRFMWLMLFLLVFYYVLDYIYKIDSTIQSLVIGSWVGISFILLDYHFKKSYLSLDLSSLDKLESGIKFKNKQIIIMVSLIILAAIASISFEIFKTSNVNIQNGSIIFIVFFLIKEVYEYIIDSLEVKNQARKQYEQLIERYSEISIQLNQFLSLENLTSLNNFQLTSNGNEYICNFKLSGEEGNNGIFIKVEKVREQEAQQNDLENQAVNGGIPEGFLNLVEGKKIIELVFKQILEIETAETPN